MTVALVMLVRDEAETLERCLLSVRPHIDSWVVCDTGSEDDTRERVRELLDGIPGRLLKEPWQDSAHNTTRLLQEARGAADWLLLLHGDMEIQSLQLPAEPEHDAYLIPERNQGLLVSTVKLVRGDRPWHYEGRCHEHLESTEPFSVGELADSLTLHHRDRARKTTNDEILAALHLDLADKPGDPRTLFYIAQTLAELGRMEEAIGYYRMRLAVTGWPEETFYARYRLGCLLTEHRGYSEGARELLAAWESAPHRAEPLRALAFAASHIADQQAVPDGALFVHADQYRAA